MNLDALFSFGMAILAGAVQFFGNVDPHVGGLLTQVQTFAMALGVAFHLDGK